MAHGPAPKRQTVTDHAQVEAAIEDLRTRLLGRAFLFDDPHAYRAGVEDTVAGLLGRRAGRASVLSPLEADT